MSTHKCPGPGCEERVPFEMLACRKHWFQVPKPERDEVWDAYRALSRNPVAAEQRHAQACAAAIRSMK